MDPHAFELSLLRAVERLIALLLGGMAIALGFRLFLKVPSSSESSAQIDIPGNIKLYLTRIGPGIFFALFGAFIVWSSYRFQVSVESREQQRLDTLSTVRKDTSRLVEQVRQDEQVSSYHGMVQTLAADSEDYKNRLSEVRRTIRTLNGISANTPAQRRVAVSPALKHGKLALLYTVWQPKTWGEYAGFAAWINDGEVPPWPNPSFQEPYEIYQLSKP